MLCQCCYCKSSGNKSFDFPLEQDQKVIQAAFANHFASNENGVYDPEFMECDYPILGLGIAHESSPGWPGKNGFGFIGMKEGAHSTIYTRSLMIKKNGKYVVHVDEFDCEKEKSIFRKKKSFQDLNQALEHMLSFYHPTKTESAI